MPPKDTKAKMKAEGRKIEADMKKNATAVIKKKVTKNLKVDLTRDELMQAGDELANSNLEGARLESDLKGVKAEYKGKLEEVVGRCKKLTTMISTKSEYRDVECEEVKDYKKGRVHVMRLDTRRIIEDRPMSEAEKQMEIKLSPEPETKTKPADTTDTGAGDTDGKA